MYKNATVSTSGINSTATTRSVFYCQNTADFTWNLHNTTIIWVLATIVLIASPITVFLNALVITAVKQRRELQKHSNILLSSMAVADLLIGAISMPINVTVDLLIVHHVSLEHVCTLYTANIDLMFIFLFSSLYHLAMVAWERYVAVQKWMDYKVIITRSRIKILAIVAWLATLFTAIPVAMLGAVAVDFKFIKTWMIIAFVSGALTVILIVYFYVMVYLGVRKRGRTIEITEVSTLAQAKLEVKVAKTTGLLTGALIFTFVLGGVLVVLGESFPAFRLNSAFRISETLLQLNSVVNPILYCYRDRCFRNAVLELLRLRKPETIQPTEGAVRFRRQKDRFSSVESVPIEQQSKEKRTRFTRSASWDFHTGFADYAHYRSHEMTLKRSMSAPFLVKDSTIFDGLQPEQHASVDVVSATIHAERNMTYHDRKCNPESLRGDVHSANGKAPKIPRSKSRDTNFSDKLAKKRIVGRPKTAPCSSVKMIDLDVTYN